MAKKWRQAGIGYVAHNLISARFRNQGWFTGPPWSERALWVYRGFAREHLTEVHRSPRMDQIAGFFYVMRVDSPPHAPARRVSVLPWTEAVFMDARIAGNTKAPPERSLALVERALARLPEVDDALEQAAHVCNQAGAFDRSLRLNRLVEEYGFDGEAGTYELAVGESYLGRRGPAFAAVRHWSRLRGSFDPELPDLVAIVYVNLAGARARAGDTAGACRHLASALRVRPALAQAREGWADMGCDRAGARVKVP
jgi:tetratricopeptide (TPR) repeat protein